MTIKLDNVRLSHWFFLCNTIVAECCKVNCLKSTVQDQFTDGSSYSGRLLTTMTAEAVHKNKIPYLGMPSNNGILIQCVVLVVAGSSAFDLAKKKIKALVLTLLHWLFRRIH